MNPPSTSEQSPELMAGATTARAGGGVSFIVLTVLIAVALIVRLLGTRNDLWLDEILSVQIGRGVSSPWEIFTAVHSDNNHYLNSLYLYMMRQETYDPALRYFSVVYGVVLIPAGYWLGSQWGRIVGLVFATLLACSYPLIHFSSEARGYSGALLGCVAGFGAMIRFMKRPTWMMGVLYGAGFSFGILSHLTACLIWFAVVLGSGIVFAMRKSRMRRLMHWLVVNLAPGTVLLTLYFVDLRYLTPLGGPPMTLAHGIGRLAALSLGWPATDAVSVLVLLVPLLVLFAWQLRWLQKDGDGAWLMLAFIFMTPVICAFFIEPTFFSPRYFLVVVPFFYLPVAMLMGRLFVGKAGRVVAGILLGLFVVSQMVLYGRFLSVGRGQFTAGLRYIAEQTQGPFLNVASSQDFRATMELQYFGRRVSPQRPFSYIRQNDQTFFSPDWYILHSEGYDPEGPERMVFADQPVWYRVAYFPASELSGQAWTVYSHRAPVNR